MQLLQLMMCAAMALFPLVCAAPPPQTDTPPGAATPTQQFSGHSVYRVFPGTREEVAFVQGLVRYMPGCDVWRLPKQLGQPLDVMIDTAAHGHWLEAQLDGAELKWSVLVGDVQELVDAETAHSGVVMSEHGSAGAGINIQSFNSHKDIVAWLDTLAVAYPHLCEVIHLGESYEGRDLRVIRVGSDPENARGVWIDGGIHAREWITTATAVWFIHKLLVEYDTSAEVRDMVDSFNWYVHPVFNPDGYHYSRTAERLWRKTRSQPDPPEGHGTGFPFTPTCVGADPDRNWDVAWGESGSSGDECSDIYRGAAAMSEPCVSAAASYMRQSLAGRLHIYLALHSYGQLWMYPYAHSANVCPDCLELANKGREAVEALSQLHGTSYIVGSTEELLHSFSGSSVDYAYTELGIKYSYYIELRDNGRYGFIIPTALIPDTADETWLGVVTMARSLLHDT